MSDAESDSGCPDPTTITSGTGRGQVPYMILRASGTGTARQVFLLLREFNREAERLAYDYCLKKQCIARYIPADRSHIKYAKRDFGGWTELTIVDLAKRPDSKSLQPQVLPSPTNKRGGFVDPPSPNVICVKPPPLPPRVKKPPVPKPSRAPVEVEPLPGRDCKQPSFLKRAGTVVFVRRFPFDPIDPGTANDALSDLVNNRDPVTNTTKLEDEVRGVLQRWIDEVQRECDRLNPGMGCRAELDPLPEVTDLRSRSGDGGVFGQVFLEYRLELTSDVRGRCK